MFFQNFGTNGLIPELGEDEADLKHIFLRNLSGNDNKQLMIELQQSE